MGTASTTATLVRGTLWLPDWNWKAMAAAEEEGVTKSEIARRWMHMNANLMWHLMRRNG